MVASAPPRYRYLHLYDNHFLAPSQLPKVWYIMVMYKKVVIIAVSILVLTVGLMGGGIYLLVRGASSTAPSSPAATNSSTSNQATSSTSLPGITSAGTSSATPTTTPTPAPTTDSSTGKQSTASLPAPAVPVTPVQPR